MPLCSPLTSWTSFSSRAPCPAPLDPFVGRLFAKRRPGWCCVTGLQRRVHEGRTQASPPLRQRRPRRVAHQVPGGGRWRRARMITPAGDDADFSLRWDVRSVVRDNDFSATQEDLDSRHTSTLSLLFACIKKRLPWKPCGMGRESPRVEARATTPPTSRRRPRPGGHGARSLHSFFARELKGAPYTLPKKVLGPSWNVSTLKKLKGKDRHCGPRNSLPLYAQLVTYHNHDKREYF